MKSLHLGTIKVKFLVLNTHSPLAVPVLLIGDKNAVTMYFYLLSHLLNYRNLVIFPVSCFCLCVNTVLYTVANLSEDVIACDFPGYTEENSRVLT